MNLKGRKEGYKGVKGGKGKGELYNYSTISKNSILLKKNKYHSFLLCFYHVLIIKQ